MDRWNVAYDKAAVKADAGWIIGKVEIAHELIHVGKELGERDWFDEPDGAECRELAPWNGSRRGGLGLLLDVSVVKKRTRFIEGVV